DEQDDVVAVVAVVGVDPELADDLEGVLAPIVGVDQGVVEGGAVVAGEAASGAKALAGGEDVGGDDLVQQASKLGMGQADSVELRELLAEVLFERGAVPDIGAVFVLQSD